MALHPLRDHSGLGSYRIILYNWCSHELGAGQATKVVKSYSRAVSRAVLLKSLPFSLLPSQ